MTDKIIQIGPSPYQYREVDELRDTDGKLIFGRAMCGEEVILVSGRLSLHKAFTTTWHEVLHAMAYSAGLDGEHDERLLMALSYAIADALERNEHMRSVGAFAEWGKAG